ncbi:hypothetical protein EVAR_68437_1 [Eumeta japonica]|uniref:Uncharacterized protein n=1 Tax=Eumeta variegata TaxID=151549 RepID=A0A4C2A0A1_EUMVA|nr:hypothetical protein EVAR_68437_1 [Eumeta japonica]
MTDNLRAGRPSMATTEDLSAVLDKLRHRYVSSAQIVREHLLESLSESETGLNDENIVRKRFSNGAGIQDGNTSGRARRRRFQSHSSSFKYKSGQSISEITFFNIPLTFYRVDIREREREREKSAHMHLHSNALCAYNSIVSTAAKREREREREREKEIEESTILLRGALTTCSVNVSRRVFFTRLAKWDAPQSPGGAARYKRPSLAAPAAALPAYPLTPSLNLLEASRRRCRTMIVCDFSRYPNPYFGYDSAQFGLHARSLTRLAPTA